MDLHRVSLFPLPIGRPYSHHVTALNFATMKALHETADPFLEIRRLGLERYASELDEYGFTVVPPELVASADFVDEVREAVLRFASKRFGIPPSKLDERAAASHPLFFAVNAIAEDEVFERALMTPTSLALITHLLGESCVLSSMGAFLKGPGIEDLALHTDNVAIPSPFPPYSQVANSTLILSDYSAENGSIVFVPRSHKLARHPQPDEVRDKALAVPVEAPSGSLVVFHGNTWHGALQRTSPGYRISLIQYFVRMYLLRQEDISYVTDEMRARNGERFGRLVGDHVPYPFSLKTQSKMFAANAAGKYQHT